MKYMALKTIKIGPLYTLDRNGNHVPMERATKTLPAKWLGYCNETKEYVDLEDMWVTQNFDKIFLVQVMSCTRSTHAFIQIPPGDCRKHQSVGPMNGPKIHDEQKDGEQINKGVKLKFEHSVRYKTIRPQRLVQNSYHKFAMIVIRDREKMGCQVA